MIESINSAFTILNKFEQSTEDAIFVSALNALRASLEAEAEDEQEKQNVALLSFYLLLLYLNQYHFTQLKKIAEARGYLRPRQSD